MPKWQQHHVWRVGALYVDERRDADLNTTVRVARFTEPTFPDRHLLLPPHGRRAARPGSLPRARTDTRGGVHAQSGHGGAALNVFHGSHARPEILSADASSGSRT